MRKLFAFCCLLTFIFPVYAQVASQPANTLPIEIKLLYSKLLFQQPDYDAIIAESPSFTENAGSPVTRTMGREATIIRQKQNLKTLFAKTGTDQPIYVHQNAVIEGIDQSHNMLRIKPIISEEPILFSFSSNETFGIFVRNGSVLQETSAPYIVGNLQDFQRYVRTVPVELPVDLILKPLSADPKDFQTSSGARIKVIWADLVDIKIFKQDNQSLLLHKQFAEAPAVQNSKLMPSVSDVLNSIATDQPQAPDQVASPAPSPVPNPAPASEPAYESGGGLSVRPVSP